MRSLLIVLLLGAELAGGLASHGKMGGFLGAEHSPVRHSLVGGETGLKAVPLTQSIGPQVVGTSAGLWPFGELEAALEAAVTGQSPTLSAMCWGAVVALPLSFGVLLGWAVFVLTRPASDLPRDERKRQLLDRLDAIQKEEPATVEVKTDIAGLHMEALEAHPEVREKLEMSIREHTAATAGVPIESVSVALEDNTTGVTAIATVLATRPEDAAAASAAAAPDAG
eukprot:CAMPEP_0204357880 /NCGR_PEP_ID=MMETSP0469-20131031/36103_1 /ASSEMBLY_ACC=CAM_ASM_000384 /TAXON_ID=2969 /ORGANISM="Oxyrrhis marina" /LENGTH=224 /DNA_ID=CAMNT_0051345637 /DNA_START=29 /DNA_END=700 /DNA_ORIENTATION=-